MRYQRTVLTTTIALLAGLTLASPAHANTWDNVAACESGGNWAISTGNGFYGGLQFTHSTWLGYGGGAYGSNANVASRSAQIAVAQRVLAGQGPGAWPVCGPRGGLTRYNAGEVVAVSRSKARAPMGRLSVDGVMGPNTTRATQRWVGAYQDGIFGPKTLRALRHKVGGTTMVGMIRGLQTRLNISTDGARHLDTRTISALQRYLNR